MKCQFLQKLRASSKSNHKLFLWLMYSCWLDLIINVDFVAGQADLWRMAVFGSRGDGLWQSHAEIPGKRTWRYLYESLASVCISVLVLYTNKTRLVCGILHSLLLSNHSKRCIRAQVRALIWCDELVILKYIYTLMKYLQIMNKILVYS